MAPLTTDLHLSPKVYAGGTVAGSLQHEPCSKTSDSHNHRLELDDADNSLMRKKGQNIIGSNEVLIGDVQGWMEVHLSLI